MQYLGGAEEASPGLAELDALGHSERIFEQGRRDHPVERVAVGDRRAALGGPGGPDVGGAGQDRLGETAKVNDSIPYRNRRPGSEVERLAGGFDRPVHVESRDVGDLRDGLFCGRVDCGCPGIRIRGRPSSADEELVKVTERNGRFGGSHGVALRY